MKFSVHSQKFKNAWLIIFILTMTTPQTTMLKSGIELSISKVDRIEDGLS